MLDFYYHIENCSTEDTPSTNQEKSEDTISSVENSSLKNRHFLSVLLEPRSLILVCNDMYKVHLHGIEERTEDDITEKVANLKSVSVNLGDKLKRETRVSLTIRNVPKVLKASFLFNKKR